MIKTIFLFLTIFLTNIILGQNFEGKISYKNTYKSKISNVTSQQLTAMMGDSQEYFIKDGNYKSIVNGSFSQWQLYVNDHNKLYNKMANSETIFWSEGSVNQDEVLKTELNKGVTEILGYKCDEVVLTCKSGTQKYYYSSQLFVDPRLFEKHKYGNWHELLLITKALPLKTIVDNTQFTLESVATEVKPIQLDRSMFTLEVNVKTAKSPY